jgi:peptidoglycan/LPS O-acetylase OafA/YrhL
MTVLDRDGPIVVAGMGVARANELKHITELDGIRGLALLLVLVLHFVSSSLGPLRRFAAVGWVGVDLFFVLSGFLITRILRNALGSTGYFRNFYGRRALRIMPLYYVVLAFAFVGTHFLPEGMRIRPTLFPFYATFTQNLLGTPGFGPWAVAVTWSLAIEEQFYLLWPLCVRLLNSRRLVWLLVVLLLILPAGRFIGLVCGTPPTTVYMTTWFRVDTLGAGALAAILVDSPLRAFVERLSLPVSVTALTIGGISAVTVFGGDRLILQQTPIGGFLAFGYGLTFSILALGFEALVVLAVSARASWLKRALRNRALRYLGKISFGVYLIHGIMIPLAQSVVRPWLHDAGLSGKRLSAVVVIFALTATFALAEISWRFLETPSLRFRKVFSSRPSESVAIPPRAPFEANSQ